MSCQRPGGCYAPAATELTDFNFKYPMYVIATAELLKLERMLPHQELLSSGVLTKWTPEMQGRVICVSHQWLGYSEPDPRGEHLDTLKRVLSRLMDGTIRRVELFWLQKLLFRTNKELRTFNWREELPHMYVWMDYISMPQVLHTSTPQKQHMVAAAKAVKSIPAYVERCALLLVLAPVCSHFDTGAVCNYASWRERGWCRLEMMVALFARNDIRVMVCPGPEATPYFIWPFDMIWMPAGEGKFSCCALGHPFGMCDKTHLRGVLEDMFDAKVHHLHETGRHTEQRYYALHREVLMCGLPGSGDSGSGASFGANSSLVKILREERQRIGQLQNMGNRLEALRTVLHWSAQDEEDAKKTGCSLLLWAAFSGDAGAVRELCADPATTIDTTLKQNVPDLPCMFKGLTPLIAAMGHANFEVVDALLQARANPEAVTAQRYDALMSATITGKSRNVAEWLRRFPKWDLRRTDVLFDATAVRVVGGSASDRVATMLALLDAHADVGDREMLIASSAWQDDSEPEVLKILLERGCDVNVPWEPSSLKLKAFFKLCRLCEHSDGGRFMAECAAFAGNTALHFAAKRGDVSLARFLVKARAEPRKNYQGRTPLEVAQHLFGGTVPPLLRSALLGEDALLVLQGPEEEAALPPPEMAVVA